MFVTAYAFSGGNKLLRLNLINGFLTGITPKDSKFLKPRTLISTKYSLYSIYSVNFKYSIGILYT